ncbi:MAG: dienelactone hydrolase family protein [Candidatus Babeliales bacterium]|jgi:dienelactone hydrolase
MKLFNLIITIAISAVVFISGALFLVFYPINQFPKPSGPYGVGITQYHWIDTQRKEPNAIDPQHVNREIMAYIFYPTNKHNHQIAYNSDQATGFKNVLGFKYKLPTWLFSGLDQLKVYEEPNAPLVSDGKKFPIIIMSHGWGALLHGWTWFCELLASNGYVVVGINHPYVAEVIRYPDGRTIKTLVFKKAAERKQEGGEQRYRAWKEDQVAVCAQDISSVVTQLEDLVLQSTMPWSTYIDLDRIGVMGGSFGGTTAMRACRKDQRIKCCIDMDGCLRGEDATAVFTKPCMMIVGSNSDQWVGRQGDSDLATINALQKRYQNTFNKVVIEGAGHGVFSDIPFYGQTTLLLQLLSHYTNFYGTASQKEQLSNDRIRAIFATLESNILGFFDKTLSVKQTSEKE